MIPIKDRQPICLLDERAVIYEGSLSLAQGQKYRFGFDLVLLHINHYRLFNTKSIFIHINSSISNNSI